MGLWNNTAPTPPQITQSMAGSVSLGSAPILQPPPYQSGATPATPSPVGQFKVQVTAKQNNSLINALKFLYKA